MREKCITLSRSCKNAPNGALVAVFVVVGLFAEAYRLRGDFEVLVSNVGTQTATISTAASHWLDTQVVPVKHMNRGQTAVATFSGLYNTKTSLAGPFVLTTNLLLSSSITAWYQVQVLLDAGSKFFTGDLDQTIVINFSC